MAPSFAPVLRIRVPALLFIAGNKEVFLLGVRHVYIMSRENRSPGLNSREENTDKQTESKLTT